MDRFSRQAFPYVALLCCGIAIYFSLAYENPPPADFTFSNGTEIKSIDPAIVTGQPEGRIIRALYEGLLDWDPKDLHPVPGVAERWEISEDKLTYTFHLRRDARWSNNTPVTADDFVYSFRRFLDPMLAAEYAFLLYYVKHAEAYNKALVEVGQRVEVELNERPPGSLPFARNALVRGTLVEVEEIDRGQATPHRVYTVEVRGRRRRFATDADKIGDASIEDCSQLLIDFDTVGIKALDRNTLRVELDHPVPFFTNLMGFYPLFPVNRECLETHGYPEWTKPRNLVTNGPFIMQSRRVRDRIRMVKNPYYWDRDNVHIEIMDALACESITTELNLYMTGQVDWISQVPSTIIPELLRQQREDFKPEPYLGIYYYKINIDEPALSDNRVRRALNLAIDKREIVDKVTRAGQIPAYRFVPPGIADYEEAKRRRSVVEQPADLQNNIQRARRLLADAGYPDGRGFPKIEILYNTNDMHAQIAELLQSQWKEWLGIDVELVNKEWGTFLADQRKQEYFVARNGWIGDYADPNTFLDLFVTDGPQNRTGWGNPRYDELIAQSGLVKLSEEERESVERQVRQRADWSPQRHRQLLKESLDREANIKRMDLFLEAEQILLQEGPVIPLYYYVSQSMVRPYVIGFHRNIQDTHPFKHMRIDQAAKERILTAEGLR